MADVDRAHIEEALELIESNGQIDSSLGGAANERRLETLVQYIIWEFPADVDDLRVSTDELDRRIRNLLDEASRQDDPIERFKTDFDQLPAEISNTQPKRYTLGVPLNLSPELPYETLDFQDCHFERISRENWISKFADPALQDDSFSDKFDQVPNDFVETFTYWEFEYASRDHNHVLEIAERYLGVILGQLIYCLFPWSHSNRFDKTTAWNRPWSELRLPFVYILRDGDGHHSAHFDDDISPRQPILMLRDRQERLETRYQQIPPLDSPNTVEEKIINAFQNFQSGATEANRRQAFLHYWRAIETLCLFDDYESMKNVVPRAEAVIRTEETSNELLKRHLEEIKNKRNSLVHEKADVAISKRDMEFLRSILYELIPFMIINRTWDMEKIKFWLENASRPTSVLENNMRKLEERIENNSRNVRIIQSIIDSR